MLEDYLSQLDGETTSGIYQMVLSEIEEPLLKTMLAHTRGNQSEAARLLGIHRTTLRKLLKKYPLRPLE